MFFMFLWRMPRHLAATSLSLFFDLIRIVNHLGKEWMPHPDVGHCQKSEEEDSKNPLKHAGISKKQNFVQKSGFTKSQNHHVNIMFECVMGSNSKGHACRMPCLQHTAVVVPVIKHLVSSSVFPGSLELGRHIDTWFPEFMACQGARVHHDHLLLTKSQAYQAAY